MAGPDSDMSGINISGTSIHTALDGFLEHATTKRAGPNHPTELCFGDPLFLGPEEPPANR